MLSRQEVTYNCSSSASGLSSPFTVAPNKQLPNREAVKRTACIQQRGLKIQSTSSAKGVAQQTQDPGACRRGALQEWSRGDGACRAVPLHAGGVKLQEPRKGSEKLSTTSSPAMLDMCIWFTQLVLFLDICLSDIFLWGKSTFTNNILGINSLHGPK